MVNLLVNGFNLKPFTLEVKSEMDHYLNISQTNISDYSFTANFMWLSNSSGFYTMVNNCFALFILQADQLTMLLPPLGEKHFVNDALVTCFEMMNSVNSDPSVSRIDFVSELYLSEFLPSVQEERERFELLNNYVAKKHLVDYVYKNDDLINLAGNSYHTKRTEINKFKRTYENIEIKRLDPIEHRQMCMGLFHRWIASRIEYMPKEDTEHFMDGISYEHFALKRMFEYYNELNLIGLVLLINGEIAGFTMGEKVSDTYASVLVEKTDFEISGAAQYIFKEFCLLLKQEYNSEFINAGDDMGLENLRKVKMSYRPVALVSKYTITQKDAN